MSEVGKEKTLLSATANVDNTPFTEEEQERLSEQLGEVRAYLLRTVALQEEQQELVDRQFDYMREATHRLGRRDWLGMAIGLLFTIMFTDPKVTASAQSIFSFAMQCIARAIDLSVDSVQNFLS